MTMARTNSTAQKFLIIAVMAGLLFSPMVSYAQYTPLAPLPCIEGNGVTCPGGSGSLNNSIDFQNYVQYAFNLIIALAAAGAVLMLVMGGLQYMTTDSWSGKSAGLDRARNALYGLLLVLTSFLILRTIDPRLVSIKSNLVTPLTIKYEAGTGLDSLLNNISNDSIYRDNMNRIVSNVTEARNNVNDLSAQQNALKNKICDQINREAGNSCGDAASTLGVCASGLTSSDPLYADCQALNRVNANLVSAQNNLDLNVGKGAMMAIIQQCTQTGDTNCADTNSLEERIKETYRKYSTKVDPEQMKQLAAYGTYAIATIDIKKQAALVNDKATLGGSFIENVGGAINNMTGGVAGRIDPTLNAALDRQKKSSIAAINQAVAKYEATPAHDPTILQELKIQAATTIQNINATVIHSCNTANC